MSPESPPSARPHILRRTLLLDAGFQFRYMFRFAAIGAFGVLIIGVLASRVIRNAVVEEGGSPEVMLASSDTLLWLGAVGAVVMAVLTSLVGLVLTHRVAGPVHVMNLYLASIAAGRYPRLRPLRSGDELREFFESLSYTVDRLREREAEEARLITEVIDALEPLATTQDAQAALRILGSMRTRKRQAIEGPTSGTLKSVA
jgi:hypothetical protein